MLNKLHPYVNNFLNIFLSRIPLALILVTHSVLFLMLTSAVGIFLIMVSTILNPVLTPVTVIVMVITSYLLLKQCKIILAWYTSTQTMKSVFFGSHKDLHSSDRIRDSFHTDPCIHRNVFESSNCPVILERTDYDCIVDDFNFLLGDK